MANRIRAPLEMLKCAERLSISVYMLGLNNTLNTFSRGSRDFIASVVSNVVVIVHCLLGLWNSCANGETCKDSSLENWKVRVELHPADSRGSAA